MRVLVINAREMLDYIRVGRLVKQFKEDIERLNQKPGRRNGIVYTTHGDYNDPVDPVYVWYTTNQITFHFGEKPHG